MAHSLISRIRDAFKGSVTLSVGANKYNQAFYKFIGGGFTRYDNQAKTYVEQGYNINPIVFSVVNQMAVKTASIPFFVKKIKDKGARKELQRLMYATKYDLTPQQHVKKVVLENKAFDHDSFDFPLETPNVLQTWTEFLLLYKTLLKLNGNVYIYMLSPLDGVNAGKPQQIYLLPSHQIEIVLKTNADMQGAESPISHYMLIEGSVGIKFEASQVIHIKYANPNFSEDGEHLYGQAPLRAALKNIESSNDSLNLNINTMKSGGTFGFIHGKGAPLTEEQAIGVKDRLKSMHNSSDALSRIQGASGELGFTKIGLTMEELQTFELLKFDQKQICNVLMWSDKLLNNDDGAKYDNVLEFRKQVVVDNIIPDLKLLSDAFNKHLLPKYKGFERSEVIFDVMDLPEMQQDIKTLVEWLKPSLDVGAITRNEYRLAIRYSSSTDADMDVHTVSTDIMSLKDALANDFNITPSE